MSAIRLRLPPTAEAISVTSIISMSRFRFLVVTIEELEPGAFQWLLLESFDDSSEFSAIERSKVTFPTHQVAWHAGCAALQTRLRECEGSD